MNKLNFSVIWKISIFTNATNKFWSLVMTGLADVDGFKISIQVCMWPGFPPLMKWISKVLVAKGELKHFYEYFYLFQKICFIGHKTFLQVQWYPLSYDESITMAMLLLKRVVYSENYKRHTSSVVYLLSASLARYGVLYNWGRYEYWWDGLVAMTLAQMALVTLVSSAA